mmetsp:Transcript_24775/g.60866  ORF Transcript_24775/g.60866 Transcript_24775/m.60866 type:complete len:121 (+) Transcript_24775:161-523(+)
MGDTLLNAHFIDFSTVSQEPKSVDSLLFVRILSICAPAKLIKPHGRFIHSSILFCCQSFLVKAMRSFVTYRREGTLLKKAHSIDFNSLLFCSHPSALLQIKNLTIDSSFLPSFICSVLPL